jgi:translation initiation factor IF-3
MKEKKSVSFDYAVNQQIRTREVRLVGEVENQQVISTYDALQRAQNQGLRFGSYQQQKRTTGL